MTPDPRRNSSQDLRFGRDVMLYHSPESRVEIYNGKPEPTLIEDANYCWSGEPEPGSPVMKEMNHLILEAFRSYRRRSNNKPPKRVHVSTRDDITFRVSVSGPAGKFSYRSRMPKAKT